MGASVTIAFLTGISFGHFPADIGFHETISGSSAVTCSLAGRSLVNKGSMLIWNINEGTIIPSMLSFLAAQKYYPTEHPVYCSGRQTDTYTVHIGNGKYFSHPLLCSSLSAERVLLSL